MKILIATATAGGGHLAAAAALEEAWRHLRPDDSVETVDVLRFYSALERKAHAKGYLQLAGHAPELYGMLFRTTDDPKVVRRLMRIKRSLPSASRDRFLRFLRQSRPDAVLCCHYLPLEVLGAYKEELACDGAGRGILVASVVTDFEAHMLWMDRCVDLYCVAAEHTRTRLIARGSPARQVLATGIPISLRILQAVDPKTVRRRYGWREDLPLVLVLSGGFGMGPVAEMVEQLDKTPVECQILVVSGRNAKLRRDLAAVDRTHPTDVIGFATNMNELMSSADLIVSKPGGLTTSEALALGKPMLIVNPIPGQETANSDFLLEQGAGVKVNRLEDLPGRVADLLRSGRLMGMSSAAARLGRPKAALDICRAVCQHLGDPVQ